MPYNVLPHLQGKTIQEVRDSIKRYPFSVAAYNVRYGVNIGSLIRTCNAFAATEFFHVGHRRYDRRPAIGTQNYETIRHFENWEASLNWMRLADRTPIAIDYVPGISQSLWDIEAFKGHPVFIMGSERNGVPSNVLKECSNIIHIPQFGSIPSLNVASAAAIVMSHWHYLRSKNDSR